MASFKSPSSRSDIIQTLPPELWVYLKSCIPPWDLRTHVCFYQTHPFFAALYDSEADADAFWRRACWLCGIGWIAELDRKSDTCWRDIAVECIERDGFCTLPGCGERLLRYNRE